jgi:predicted transcriptional regulator
MNRSEPMTAAFTVRLDDKVLQELDALGEQTDRSRNWLVNEALRQYLELQAWQTAKIRAGIEAAERGDFATDEELNAIEAELEARIRDRA